MHFLTIRLARGVVALLLVMLFVFIMLRLAPGDPVSLLLGPSASPQAVAELRHQLGLENSLARQFIQFVVSLVDNGGGLSLTYQQPVFRIVMQAFPATLYLSGGAFVLTLLIAIPAGIAAAVWHGRWPDWAVRATIIVTQAMPTFWIGIMFIFFFAVHLHWLPTSGNGSFRHLILPAVTLSIYQFSLLANVIRASMLDVLREDYIVLARAKGLRPWQVVLRHGFRNILIPTITVLALQLGAVLSGSVVTEAVFAWPGIGTLALNAIQARDYPLVQGVVILGSTFVIALNLLADFVCLLIDPRLAKAAVR